MLDLEKCRKEGNAIKWLSTAHLTCDLYNSFLNPLMPFIAAKLGFTMTIATIIMGISHICSNLLQPIFGFFADNIYKRFFIFWGVLLSSIFIPLAILAPNIFLLTMFMVLGSLGGSLFHPQAFGFINYFSKSSCTNNMGLFICFGAIGFALGPLVVTFIMQYAGLEKIIYTSIFGLIVTAVMFVFVPKLSNIPRKPEPHKDFLASLKELLSNKQIDILIVIATMKALITMSFNILLPFLWKEMGHSPFYIGCALFLFIFVGSISSYISPHVERKYGAALVIYFSMLATLPLVVLFCMFLDKPVISLIIYAITGFTTNFAQPVIVVLAQETLPKYKSLVSGFMNGFCWGIVAVTLSFIGVVAQKIGIINVLLILSTIPAICSFFVKYLNFSTKSAE